MYHCLPKFLLYGLFALILASCSELNALKGFDGKSRNLSDNKVKSLPVSNRSKKIVKRQQKPLSKQLAKKGLALGNPVFLQIFKRESEVKVWMQPEKGQDYKFFKTYPICNYSGNLGPKLKEGDKQSPEGFYSVKPAAMNPNSSYHLSFNLGFPNRYDRSFGRTGSYLMVHGNCISVGCYAMGDDQIEEIYTLAEEALRNGQKSFKVHAFPFYMTDENLAAQEDSKWHGFWTNMKEGYDTFETTRRPPRIKMASKRYVVRGAKDITPEPVLATFKDGRHKVKPNSDADKAASIWDKIMMDDRILSSEDSKPGDIER